MITHAIQSLCPDAEWTLDGTELKGLKWLSKDIARPTDAEIMAEAERLTVVFQTAREIEALEKSITSRNIRAALGGDPWAIDKIAKVEADIEALGARN